MTHRTAARNPVSEKRRTTKLDQRQIRFHAEKAGNGRTVEIQSRVRIGPAAEFVDRQLQKAIDYLTSEIDRSK